MLHTDVIVSVPELLAKHSRERPTKTAFRDATKTVSFHDLNRRTSRLAGHLLDEGLRPQDRLLMFLDNCVEVAEGYLVAPRAGIVTVCANRSAAASEFAHILSDSAAVAVLTDAARLAIVMELAQTSPSVRTVIVAGDTADPLPTGTGVRVLRYDDLITTEPSTSVPDNAGLDTWCWTLYTSGTTGKPKGVNLTQRSCLWVVAACWIPIAGLSDDDVVYSALPLFHSYALSLCVLAVVASGATELLATKFFPTDTLRVLREEPVTFLPGGTHPVSVHVERHGAGEPGRTGVAPVRLRRCADALGAQRVVREVLLSATSGRVRHHRDLDDGHDELSNRRSGAGL